MIFFSATGLITNFGSVCAATGDGDVNDPVVQSENTNAITGRARDIRSFIVLLLGLMDTSEAASQPEGAVAVMRKAEGKGEKTPKFEETVGPVGYNLARRSKDDGRRWSALSPQRRSRQTCKTGKS